MPAVTASTRRDRFTVEPASGGLQLVDPSSPAGVQPSGLMGWSLAFSDEFNGSSLDRLKWDTVYPAWPRFLAQSPGGNRTNTDNANYYSDALATVDGSSNLVLTMAQDSTTYPGLSYKSGMVQSLKSFTTSPGSFVEMRIQVPVLSNIIWPAGWESNAATDQWPPETDIFELFGMGPGIEQNVYVTTSDKDTVHVNAPSSLTSWHTYGAWWKSDGTTVFYIDGAVSRTSSKAIGGSQYLILNLAARTGQSWPGANPTMLVDYIRSWR
ncbi:hypothetical protein LLS1_18330 [Leifsonia sp. LS1]|uniref:glycoside hydrolase family 16 protein n=1 Tax=Leifsonia sp. LS1 TaxID=2828483 RepID=UPI001CFD5E44|nr:glycoside hydrolase family 16 protein [Leifsonia sp. LS1]GIT80164.1 hypothetical protein LLS1_18330 [Leifsonia sp. LS1]